MNIDDLTFGQLKQIQAMTQSTKPSGTAPSGRAVLVIDRGWIVAGDMSVTADDCLRLDNAVHVFSWSGIGFAKMLEDWKSSKVDLRPLPTAVEVPRESVIFRCPVAADWGKK